MGLWSRAVLAVYWIVLLTLTHWPHLKGVDIPGKDKTEHVLAYGLLSALILVAASHALARHRGLRIAAGMVALIAVAAALDEWTQPYFGRSCELGDWIADVSSATGVSVIYLAAKWVSSRGRSDTAVPIGRL